MTKTVADKLTDALQAAFSPGNLEVIDESHQHAGHREAGDGKETHFRVRITSDALAGKSRVMQHKAIYAVADPWMNAPIHALAIEITE